MFIQHAGEITQNNKLDDSRQYIMRDHCLQIWNTKTNKSPDMSVC